MPKKCEFRKRSGGRCGADAQIGNRLCVFHDPARSHDAERARRAGGVNRTRIVAVLPSETPDNPLGSIRDVSVLLGDSINRLRRGELDPKVANAVGYLASVLLRALEHGSTEQRLAHLESIMGKGNSDLQIFDFQPESKKNEA